MIPFNDLNRVISPYKSELSAAINTVLEKGWFIQGNQLKDFEDSFALYCQAKNCVGVGSGLDALSLVLKSWLELGKIKEGDELILPSNTNVATALAVKQNSLKAVFAEPNSESYLMDVESIKQKLSKKTKILLPVHLFGQMVNMDAILELAHQHNLLVLEDAAQAHGASFKNKAAGSQSNAAAYSFYPTKNLGAMGDGGAVVTNDDELADMVRMISNYGSKEKNQHEVLGVNSRLDEVQAAYLSVRLKYLDKEIEARTEIAKNYLSSIHNPKVKMPKVNQNVQHAWHLFVVQVEERDAFQEYLLQHDVQTLIHYPYKLNELKIFGGYESTGTHLNHKIISLPLFPNMTLQEQEQVIELINKW